MIPPPPAPDAVLFRTSAGRAVAGYAGAAVLVWLIGAGVYAGLATLLGRPVDRIVDFRPFPLFFGLLVPILGVSVGTLIRSPNWVRLSAGGVEIGTTRARAILIPWSGVESATVRGLSVLATLDVVLRPAGRAALQDAEGRLPQMHTRSGRRGYWVQVGLFPGGPGAVMAALRARGVQEPRLPSSTVGPR